MTGRPVRTQSTHGPASIATAKTPSSRERSDDAAATDSPPEPSTRMIPAAETSRSSTVRSVSVVSMSRTSKSRTRVSVTARNVSIMRCSRVGVEPDCDSG